MKHYALVFGPADVSYDMADMNVLYKTNSCVRSRFEHVSQLTNLSVEVLLQQTSPSENLSRMELVSLGLAAGLLGIADHLSNKYGAAVCAGGVSIGELIALAAANAIDLNTMVEIISLRKDFSDPSTNSGREGVGFLVLPRNANWSYYQNHDRLSVAVDYGEIQGGVSRLLMISGLHKDLQHAASDGPGTLDILPDTLCQAAYHSRYRSWIRDLIDNRISSDRFNNPDFPVISCLDSTDMVTSADNARNITLRSETECLRVGNLVDRINTTKAEQIFALGPFLRSLRIDFGLPVDFYDKEWVKNEYNG